MSSFSHMSLGNDIACPIAFKNASYLLNTFESSSSSFLDDSLIDDYIQIDVPKLERAPNPLPTEFVTYTKQMHIEPEFTICSHSHSNSLSDTEDSFVYPF
ncbi:hypothetical protein QTN25_005167 [Entamoeba marina]